MGGLCMQMFVLGQNAYKVNLLKNLEPIKYQIHY